ncbi:MAG: dienelactone hydrolase family protein, partial [Planctomycetes bacterium]|nr:dienelactone hydrolase family protein [Planctomycetota bacterium]
MHYEPGYAYPLVVWLHGTPGNEHQLLKVMPLVSMRNYVAIAPRATAEESRNRNAYHWRQTQAEFEESETRIFDCIAIAKRRFNIHGERVFLAGYGAGGTMAVRIAWSNPDRFAGVASLGGSLP